MDARHGPALSRYEQRVLTGIERELSTDEELELALRTMRFRRLRRFLHRPHGKGGNRGTS